MQAAIIAGPAKKYLKSFDSVTANSYLPLQTELFSRCSTSICVCSAVNCARRCCSCSWSVRSLSALDASASCCCCCCYVSCGDRRQSRRPVSSHLRKAHNTVVEWQAKAAVHPRAGWQLRTCTPIGLCEVTVCCSVSLMQWTVSSFSRMPHTACCCSAPRQMSCAVPSPYHSYCSHCSPQPEALVRTWHPTRRYHDNAGWRLRCMRTTHMWRAQSHITHHAISPKLNA